MFLSSNNTNKLSPQEQAEKGSGEHERSNNTNKLSPQEQVINKGLLLFCSNNTNKLSPQEPADSHFLRGSVQIIQINLVLKN